jgi:abequosyltransferase
MIRLSICIPTYNFGKFIGETLDSIINQADESIEIVIVDGGSTDNTFDVIDKAQQSFPNIKLIRIEKKRGVDPDILESVRQATGQYCWLMSSDDVLAPGSLAKVIEQLEQKCDVLLLNRINCDKYLKPISNDKFVNVDSISTFDWNIQAQRRQYFESALSCGAFFSYISSVVFLRERWDGLTESDCFIGSCWIIAARMFEMSRRGIVVRYVPDSLILNRGDNDSFASLGVVQRACLAIDGFRLVVEHFFGVGSLEARQVDRVLKNDYSLSILILLKLRLAYAKDRDGVPEFNRLVRRHYAGDTLADVLRRILVITTPVWCLVLLRWVSRRIRGVVQCF